MIFCHDFIDLEEFLYVIVSKFWMPGIDGSVTLKRIKYVRPDY
jgi:hypothetical protein